MAMQAVYMHPPPNFGPSQQQPRMRFASPSTSMGISNGDSPFAQPGTSQQQQQQQSQLQFAAGGSGPFMPFYLRPAYRFKNPQFQSGDGVAEGAPGRRLRKTVVNVRRQIDYVGTVFNHLQRRLVERDARDSRFVQPDLLYSTNTLPASSPAEKPINCVMTKFVRAAMNKIKCPIYTICWTPEGKRLITGASTGEFTLWNGIQFNFETILQAHDTMIRALKWSHSDQWLVSADHDGYVKYWQPNMNNVHMYQAHKEAVRSLRSQPQPSSDHIGGLIQNTTVVYWHCCCILLLLLLSFCPTDAKLATGSDDGTARVWDFSRCVEERILRGHGSDIRSVDWHPTKSLLATGSRDAQQPVKLWDPKGGQCLATLHDHKNSVMAVQWNKNGNWLITGSRDHMIKLYDIRTMRELRSFRGHKKEVTSLAWHPVHEGFFVSGGGDGSLMYWTVDGSDKELGLVENAHDQAVWTLEWHPLGHILASGSNDNNTKFWCRNKPGDTVEDFHSTTGGILTTGNVSIAGDSALPTSNRTTMVRPINDDEHNGLDRDHTVAIPGMGLDDDVLEHLRNEAPPESFIPGLGSTTLLPEDPSQQLNQLGVGAKRTLIKQPPPRKAQRQFERIWNTATAPEAGGGDADTAPTAELPNMKPTVSFKKTKGSLLGAPPPPSLMGRGQPPPQQQQQTTNVPLPPMPPPPLPPGGWSGGMPPPFPMPPIPSMPSFVAPVQQPADLQARLGPMWQLPPQPLQQQQQPVDNGGGDKDYRLPAFQPPSVVAGDVDLRQQHPTPTSASDVDLRAAAPPLATINTRDPRRRPAGPSLDDAQLQAAGAAGGSFVNPKRKWQQEFEQEEQSQTSYQHPSPQQNWQQQQPSANWSQQQGSGAQKRGRSSDAGSWAPRARGGRGRGRGRGAGRGGN